MKNIIFMACAVGVIALGSCKKNYDRVSQEVAVSAPTISFTGGKFYSIPVGGTVPSISATAYDSVIGEIDTVAYDPSVIDNTTPGLYVVVFDAKNKYGFTSQDVAYVAVTNISNSINLAGTYKRTSNSATVHVTKILRGLYSTDDVGGAPTLPVTAYFAQLNDTTLSLPPQPTSVGTLSASNAKIHMATGDTSFSYIVVNGSFGTALRTFKKQ